MTEFISIPGIVIICYLIGMWIKTFNNEKLDKFIPCICGTVGAGLGLLVFYTIPGFMDASNWLTALGIGITSGFTAVGVNQVYKQIKKE